MSSALLLTKRYENSVEATNSNLLPEKEAQNITRKTKESDQSGIQQGSLYYQPKQCILKGKFTNIVFAFFDTPKMGPI